MNKLVVLCLDALCTSDIPYMKTLNNFKYIFDNGSYVKHVEPVYPTLTYPCHCSIVTGRYVKGHGVPHNEIVEAENPKSPWYSLRSSIQCDTFLDEAHKYGLKTCSLTWPVSGGADIDYNLPMIVPISYQGDDPEQFYRNNSTQELLDRYFWKYDHYLKGEERNLDAFTMSCALDIIEDYGQPDVMLVKTCDLDTVKHVNGISNVHVEKQLRIHDEQLGLLFKAVKRFGDFNHTNWVILGDHGQSDIKKHINFNLLLKDKGLLTTDENGKLLSYDAYCHSASMSGWIEVKNPEDKALVDKVYKVLQEIQADPKYNIGYLFTKEEASKQFGLEFPKIDFVVEGKEPMSFDSTLSGKDLFEEYLKPGWHHSTASHGYLPFKDQTTTFIACGPAVKQGVVIERSSMVNEASTMSKMVGYDFNGTDGTPWEEMLKD